VILLAGIAVGLSDLVSSHLLKNLFGRIRPCHVLPDVHLLAGCTSSFSFPSSHAANISSAATVLVGRFPATAFFMVPLALVVSVSRVSVGVHWPSDAIGGIVTGILCGLLALLVAGAAGKRWKGAVDGGRIEGDAGWFFCYTLLMVLLFPVLLIVYGKGVATSRRGRIGFSERLGKIAGIGGRPLWVHAASVGETTAALTLIDEIRRAAGEIPVVLSVNTSAARAIAEGRIKGGTVCYFPFDFPWIVKRALDRIGPRAVVFMEAEIWPNFVREVRRRGLPLLLVNGRMSERTHKGFSRIGGFIRRVLGRFSLVTAQSDEYRERYTSLGCDPDRVVVTGNIKYDIGPDEKGVAEDVARFLTPNKGRIVIAGSTHAGEEEIVLDAFGLIAAGTPDALLVLAPRHLARTADVERLLKGRSIGYVKRSELGRGTKVSGGASGEAVLLLDTLGELAGLLTWGDVIFIGGSLVPGIGGHNVLEAAAVGKAPIFGPHMGNFPQISRGLIEAGGGFMARDAGEIADIAGRLISDRASGQDAGRRALELVRANRGATGRTVSAVRAFVTGER
jgi:3-deoxy-D-manno-octulosonic-acid transferase